MLPIEIGCGEIWNTPRGLKARSAPLTSGRYAFDFVHSGAVINVEQHGQ
jgi:hypothetical protein